MDRKKMRRIASLLLFVLCGVLLCLPGCSMPRWGRKTAHSVPGVTPPYERIAQLRRQRDQARKMSPAEAEQLAAQLGPQCADEDDPVIRAEIVRTLGALDSQSARQTLLAAGHDPSSEVRIAACETWALIGDEAAASELARILSSDVDQEVRFAAAKGLGKTRSPQSVAALGSVLQDRDPAMQYLAMESLKETTGQNFGHDARRWEQYVQGKTPVQTEKSIAQKAMDLF